MHQPRQPHTPESTCWPPRLMTLQWYLVPRSLLQSRGMKAFGLHHPSRPYGSRAPAFAWQARSGRVSLCREAFNTWDWSPLGRLLPV